MEVFNFVISGFRKQGGKNVPICVIFGNGSAGFRRV
jgi:hypothetical protein